MKALKRIVVFAVVGLLIVTSGIAMARGWGRGPGVNQKGAGPGAFMGEEMYNARVSILAELAGQSEDTIKSKLDYKPTWAVIDEYKVDYKAFQAKMQEKRTAVVKQAVADGKITQAQADFMIERMNQAPGQRRGGRGFGKGGGRGFNGNCPRF